MAPIKGVTVSIDLKNFALGFGLVFSSDWPSFLSIDLGPVAIHFNRLAYWKNGWLQILM